MDIDPPTLLIHARDHSKSGCYQSNLMNLSKEISSRLKQIGRHAAHGQIAAVRADGPRWEQAIAHAA
jgi:hypothetical protein